MNRLQEKTKMTGYIHASFQSDEGSGEINITAWTKIPKIEIYTRRGQSYVVEGESAIEFATWLRDEVVNPILKEASNV